MSLEERVLEALDVEEGQDRWEIAMVTGLTRTQVSGALFRLQRQGRARCARWAETFVWHREPSDS